WRPKVGRLPERDRLRRSLALPGPRGGQKQDQGGNRQQEATPRPQPGTLVVEEVSGPVTRLQEGGDPAAQGRGAGSRLIEVGRPALGRRSLEGGGKQGLEAVGLVVHGSPP